MILLIIILLGTTAYFGYQYYLITQNPNKVATLSEEQARKNAEAEFKKVVGEVSKIILLPINETPNIVTVADPSLLKDRPFFANSKKDDIVLIYPKAQKAILYRPSTNMIIEVAPIDQSADTQPPTNAATTTKETSTTKKSI